MTRIEQIMALIKERGPMTADELAQELGCVRQTVNMAILEFRTHNKGVLRIASFDTSDRRHMKRRFGLGNAPDAVYVSIKGKTPAQAAELRHAQERVSHIKPFKDPLVWALFGGGS